MTGDCCVFKFLLRDVDGVRKILSSLERIRRIQQNKALSHALLWSGHFENEQQIRASFRNFNTDQEVSRFITTSSGLHRTKIYFNHFSLPSSSSPSSFSFPQRATTRSQTKQTCSAASLSGPESGNNTTYKQQETHPPTHLPIIKQRFTLSTWQRFALNLQELKVRKLNDDRDPEDNANKK